MIPFFEVLKLAKNWLQLMSGCASFHGGARRSTSSRAADSAKAVEALAAALAATLPSWVALAGAAFAFFETRTRPFDVAAQLGLAPGAEVIIRDRIMGDPATGRPTQLATSYLPADLADELPVLAARETGRGGIYDRMEEAGLGPILWTESITTRPPTMTEARRLRMTAGIALLHIIRLATSPAGRPLEVNDTRMNGDEFEISYPLRRHPSAGAELP